MIGQLTARVRVQSIEVGGGALTCMCVYVWRVVQCHFMIPFGTKLWPRPPGPVADPKPMFSRYNQS